MPWSMTRTSYEGKLGTPALLCITGKLRCVCDVLKQSSAIKRNASLYFAVYSYTLRMIAGERDSVASRRERSGWTSGTVVLLALLAYGGSITTESCRVLYAAV